MKAIKLTAGAVLSLSLALGACQANINPLTEPTLTQQKALATEKIHVRYSHKPGFQIQAVDFSRIAFLRLTVMGADLASPRQSDFIAVTPDTLEATLTGIPRVNDALRLVIAQAYDSDENLLAAFEARGWYTSASAVSSIDVTVNRQQLLTGQIIENLLAGDGVGDLDLALVQSRMLEVAGYDSSKNVFENDPTLFDANQLTTDIVTEPMPDSTSLRTAALATRGSVALNLQTPTGGALAEDLRVMIADPQSTPKTLSKGGSSPSLTIDQVNPGTWAVRVETQDGALVGTSEVTVDLEGNPTVVDDPIALTGVAESTLPAGTVSTFAGTPQTAGNSGDGGPATDAEIDDPRGLAQDSEGNLFIAGDDSFIRMIPANNGNYYGINMTAGNIYIIAGDGTEANTGDGGPATDSQVYRPRRITFDDQDNLVFTSFAGQKVRMIPRVDGTYFNQSMTAGNIYTIAGTGNTGPLNDNLAATSANLFHPFGVDFGPDGDLYLADCDHHLIRKIDSDTGIITTVAGTGTQGFNANAKPALDTHFSAPAALKVDDQGNIFIGEIGNFEATGNTDYVRMIPAKNGTYYGQIMNAGNVYIVAGVHPSCTGGCIIDPGDNNDDPPFQVRLKAPRGLDIDGAGNLYIIESGLYSGPPVSGSSVIRMIPMENGEFYGVTMETAYLYTMAGVTGTNGFDSNTASTEAKINFGFDLLVNDNGQLFYADTANHIVRVIE